MSTRSRRGRPAVTHWCVLERFPGSTLVRLAPETGRTHQLRVHLAALSHPVLGDAVYGARRGGRVGAPGVTLARHALHAEVIRFTHPATGDRMMVRAPLPEDLDQVLAALRQTSGTLGKSPRLS
jgi:23S rRNA pseudouridine1911/1915/1917 synthase